MGRLDNRMPRLAEEQAAKAKSATLDTPGSPVADFPSEDLDSMLNLNDPPVVSAPAPAPTAAPTPKPAPVAVSPAMVAPVAPRTESRPAEPSVHLPAENKPSLLAHVDTRPPTQA